jgi:hypothetical protein|tara:strand:- start:110 stop:460 length:351 start_codon:yes stop_codon:yes gene_type:complete
MKIKNYIMWCEDNGYVNEDGKADSMAYANEYMKGKAYAKEHKNQALQQELKDADPDSLYGMMHSMGKLLDEREQHPVIAPLRAVGMNVFDGDDIQYMLDNNITPDMVGLGTPKDKK